LNNSLAIFDCDGTILDSMEQLTQLAIYTISRSYSISPRSAKRLYERTLGVPFREQLETLFPSDERNNYVAAVYENKHRELNCTFPLAPKLEQLLSELADKGFLCALVTSTDFYILRDHSPQITRLKFDSMSGYFVGNNKITQIRNTIISLEADTSKTLYIGDADFDQVCAIDNGIKFVRTKSSSLRDDVLYAVEYMDLL
jgi:phosphoglycolate phosphatase-like HAD superfamily hydrolase